MPKQDFDEYHKHELLDRIHSINVMFDQLVVDHAAAGLLKDEIKQAGEVLADLYQKAGALHIS